MNKSSFLEHYGVLDNRTREFLDRIPALSLVLEHFDVKARLQYTEGPINLESDLFRLQAIYLNEHLLPNLERYEMREPPFVERHLKALSAVMNRTIALSEFYLLFDITDFIFRVDQVGVDFLLHDPSSEKWPLSYLWVLFTGRIPQSRSLVEVFGTRENPSPLLREAYNRNRLLFTQVVRAGTRPDS